MKFKNNLILAVGITVLLLSCIGCSEPKPVTDPNPEYNDYSYMGPLASQAGEVVVTEQKKSDPNFDKKSCGKDPSIYGTWAAFDYSDVIHFTNDACYGRVNLLGLITTTSLSEGGIYSASNGEIKVWCYTVNATPEDSSINIVEGYHTYSKQNGNLIFDGKTYRRIQ